MLYCKQHPTKLTVWLLTSLLANYSRTTRLLLMMKLLLSSVLFLIFSWDFNVFIQSLSFESTQYYRMIESYSLVGPLRWLPSINESSRSIFDWIAFCLPLGHWIFGLLGISFGCWRSAFALGVIRIRDSITWFTFWNQNITLFAL